LTARPQDLIIAAGWDQSDTIGNSRPDMRPHLYQRPDFRAGLACLAARGLSFDAWLYHPQLSDVVDLARAFPAAPIIMGHVGGVLGYGPYAGRKDEVFAAWKRSMTDLAACPNIVVKLGGMMRRLAAFDYGAPPRRLLPSSWPDIGDPICRPASNCSAPTAACSRATSRSRKSAPAMRSCRTRSSALPPAPRLTRNSYFSTARHVAAIASTARRVLDE
jgi:Amidohydrolase